MKSDIARELEIKYKIRKLILSGKVKIPVADAARLIGPDAAYRLYSTYKTGKKKEE